MIVIRNNQRKVKIDRDKLKRDAQTILSILEYSDYDLGILLTHPKKIHELNKLYRNKDKPTDILSFSYYPDLKPGQRIKPKSPEDKNLGDLVICPEYVLEDLPKWNMTFDERLEVLLVHGICHLLGYDHIKDSDYKIMHKKEQFLLKKLRLTHQSSCLPGVALAKSGVKRVSAKSKD